MLIQESVAEHIRDDTYLHTDVAMSASDLRAQVVQVFRVNYRIRQHGVQLGRNDL